MITAQTFYLARKETHIFRCGNRIFKAIFNGSDFEKGRIRLEPKSTLKMLTTETSNCAEL